MDSAPPGARLCLGSGVFTLPAALQVAKDLTLVGQGVETTILRRTLAQAEPEGDVLLVLGPVQTVVRVEGLTITGGKNSNGFASSGLSVYDADVALVDCAIRDNSGLVGGIFFVG